VRFVTAATGLGILTRNRGPRVAAAAVMSVAEELVIAVCANAPQPGHSAYESERRQRPDRNDPKILARRTHFQENSRLTPSKPLNSGVHSADSLKANGLLSSRLRKILRRSIRGFNISLSALTREPLQTTLPLSIQHQPVHPFPSTAPWHIGRPPPCIRPIVPSR